MTASSLVPFLLVFFLLSWALSAMVGSTALLMRSRLRRSGPQVERVASSLAIILPVAVPFYVVLSLAGHSLFTHAPRTIANHCTSHSHHLHVCLQHGEGWADVPVYVAALTIVGLQLIVRLVWRLRSTLRTLASIRRLEALAVQRLRVASLSVFVVPSKSRFCLLAPLPHPHVVVSSTAWDALDHDERQAVIEHELAHARQGDAWQQNLLDLFALVGIPGLTHRVVGLWRDATERLCDLSAARAIGDATCVAHALLKLTPAMELAPAPSFAAVEHIEGRVHALLTPPPDDGATARQLRRAILATAIAVAFLLALLADPLHHAIETLLG